MNVRNNVGTPWHAKLWHHLWFANSSVENIQLAATHFLQIRKDKRHRQEVFRWRALCSQRLSVREDAPLTPLHNFIFYINYFSRSRTLSKMNRYRTQILQWSITSIIQPYKPNKLRTSTTATLINYLIQWITVYMHVCLDSYYQFILKAKWTFVAL